MIQLPPTSLGLMGRCGALFWARFWSRPQVNGFRGLVPKLVDNGLLPAGAKARHRGSGRGKPRETYLDEVPPRKVMKCSGQAASHSSPQDPSHPLIKTTVGQELTRRYYQDSWLRSLVAIPSVSPWADLPNSSEAWSEVAKGPVEAILSSTGAWSNECGPPCWGR